MRNRQARFASAASSPDVLPALAWPEIALAGRSNVGKSSLLNRLVGQRGLARVSKTPGRTQQINFFVVEERLTLVDLPGYGFARVPREIQAEWKGLIEGYLSRRANLRSVGVLVDLRRGIGDEDRMLLDYTDSLGLDRFVVVTKIDKLARGERLQRLRALEAESVAVVATSAQTGEGIDALWEAIEARLDRRRGKCQ